MVTKKRLGWALVLIFTLVSLVVGYYSNSPTSIFWALLLVLVLFLGLLSGQLLLIWHYSPFFQTTPGMIVTALFFILLTISRSSLESMGSSWVVSTLHLEVMVWLLTGIFAMGGVVWVYLLGGTRALAFNAGTFFFFIFLCFIYLLQVGSKELFLTILRAQPPALFQTAVCLLWWGIPIGAIIFLWQMIKYTHQEFLAWQNQQIRSKTDG